MTAAYRPSSNILIEYIFGANVPAYPTRVAHNTKSSQPSSPVAYLTLITRLLSFLANTLEKNPEPSSLYPRFLRLYINLFGLILITGGFELFFARFAMITSSRYM